MSAERAVDRRFPADSTRELRAATLRCRENDRTHMQLPYIGLELLHASASVQRAATMDKAQFKDAPCRDLYHLMEFAKAIGSNS